MERTITIENIVALFVKSTDKKKMKDIKSELIQSLYPEQLIIDPIIQNEIDKTVERVIRDDSRNGNESYLIRDRNGKYGKRRNRRTPTIDVELDIDSNYIGKAGECAVVSELMFRGYNANTMLLDEGIDIIATKNNIYYYIHVKTTQIKNGRLYVKIKKERFDKYIENQIRYVVVGRYEENNSFRNIFFVFDPQTIDRLARYEHCINESESALNIKIEFEPRTGKYYMYDDKRIDVSYYIDKFL